MFSHFSLKRGSTSKMLEINFQLVFLPTLRDLVAVIIVITKGDRRILWNHEMTVDVFHNFTRLCVHKLKGGLVLL